MSKASDDYIDSLKATDSIDQPAVGFANPAEVKKDSVSAIALLIKQNNTIIQLLLNLSDRVRNLEEKHQTLNTEPLSQSISELKSKIFNLSLGEGSKTITSRAKGPRFVFKNPKDIFDSEKQKAKSQ